MVSANDILEYWFEQAGPEKWYARSDAFDASIRAKFEEFSVSAAAQLKKQSKHSWQEEPTTALALIITLDQFPRNMYRENKGAFAWDGLALSCAQQAVERGFDLETEMNRRQFFYLPYMHAEDLATQDECVRLIDTRLDSSSNLFHAKAHRKLIADFGRFPHRNEMLGRENTDAEKEFLADGGYTP
jgi:uncharacterized protein (DUF924 family)